RATRSAIAETSSLPLHDALPISTWGPSHAELALDKPAKSRAMMSAPYSPMKPLVPCLAVAVCCLAAEAHAYCRTTTCSALPEGRSEEHTSELQSRENLVCRLLLE